MKRAVLALTVALTVTLGSTGCLAFHAGPLPGAPEKAQYVEVEGVRIRYEDKGEGPAVVLGSTRSSSPRSSSGRAPTASARRCSGSTTRSAPTSAWRTRSTTRSGS
ncbi:MAG: hypothetical protein IPJ34_00045 [Myxococcales bacterium]|nr:hypothetical protein [Myxococcales bacterium]